jgi:hypothetical protein
MENADDLLFRCSALGHLMKEPKGSSAYFIHGVELTTAKANKLIDEAIKTKSIGNLLGLEKRTLKPSNDDLAEGVKTHLVDVYVAAMYERHEEISSKYLDKGNETEENSITIVSRMTKEFYKKNETTLRNNFICGTPDLFKGKDIHNATHIRDTKSSYSVYTFHRSISKELLDLYYWQVQGYMALSGAQVANVDYCLNNTPFNMIEAELRRESYKYLEGNTPNWIDLQIAANHIFDRNSFEEFIQRIGINPTDENSKAIVQGFVEIPLEKRWFTFEVKRNDEDIQRLYDRIRQCRNWINERYFNDTISTNI